MTVVWARGAASLATAVVLLLTVGCSFNSQLGNLRPNVLPASTYNGMVVITVEGAPDEERCTRSSGSIRRFCIKNAGVANRSGLHHLLRAHGLTPVSPGTADYTATLRFRRFTNALDGSEHQAVMSIEWQFELKDRGGVSILTLAERTTSPQPVTGRGDVAASARSMFEAVLEQISRELSSTSEETP